MAVYTPAAVGPGQMEPLFLADYAPTHARALTTWLDFDEAFRVNPDGTVDTNLTGVHSPDVLFDLDYLGQLTDELEHDGLEYVRSQGWEALTGHSGQYRYDGPIMHASETFSGGLVRRVLSEPGIYVLTTADVLLPNDEDPLGWLVLRKIKED